MTTAPVTPGTSSGATATAIGGYVAAIVAALEARGLDSRTALAAAGIDHVPVNSPVDRVPVPHIGRLYEAARAATGDDTFGLDVAEHLRAESLHALGFSLQASTSLRDFGLRLSRYHRFLSPSATQTFTENDTDVAIEARVIIGPVPFESIDATVSFYVRFLHDLSDGRCRPHRVQLMRPVPADGGARYRACFQVPVDFEQPFVAIRFARSMADIPFERGNRELALHNDQVVIRYLAKLDRSDITARVKTLIIQHLPSGEVTKVAIAKQLNMSPRTLQHKLALCKTTFQALVNETRRELACGYMRSQSMSVTEATYLLGFSDTSNFNRAFRRWTGHSPSEYRNAAPG